MHLRAGAMVAACLATCLTAQSHDARAEQDPLGVAFGAPAPRPSLMAARNPLPPDSTPARDDGQSAPRLGHIEWPPLLVKNANTAGEALVHLYGADGALSESGVSAFRQVASENEKPAPLNSRVLQLVVKAAYELGAKQIVLVSTYRAKDRRGKGGYHTSGDAIDFRLPGVGARPLASYLRKLPRVGVGVYTHPKTQYVHLDVRDQSYHWLDSSPPGRTWKEGALKDGARDARDAAWTPASDLPRLGS